MIDCRYGSGHGKAWISCCGIEFSFESYSDMASLDLKMVLEGGPKVSMRAGSDSEVFQTSALVPYLSCLWVLASRTNATAGATAVERGLI